MTETHVAQGKTPIPPKGIFGNMQLGNNTPKPAASPKERSSKKSPVCPECNSSKVWRDGRRTPMFGESIQRWLCRDCGYRFSDPEGMKQATRALRQDQAIESKALKRNSALHSKRQICVTGAKNLATATEIKTVAGDIERLPQENRGLLAKFAAYLEREGFYEETSYFDLVRSLANSGANLLDPEDVKTKIAKHQYQGKDGKKRPWKNSSKMLASYAYDQFCKMEGLQWTRPTYKQEETILIVPDEKLLDALILSASRRMAAFLQCLKETYADPGEILALQWNEIRGNILPIAHPCKGHLPGQYEVTARLISMLSALPRTDKRVFPTNYRAINHCLGVLKKKVARKLGDYAVLEITFKSYRHWGGSMIAHYTNGNVLTVQKMLRHKSILNTMKYIHTVNFKDNDFDETVATTPEEVRKLGKAGWTKYDEMTSNGVTMHFYRKPKRFGGLQ